MQFPNDQTLFKHLNNNIAVDLSHSDVLPWPITTKINIIVIRGCFVTIVGG